MTKIKICGLMRMEDVLTVNRHKPEYAGFVFARSRREVTVQAAKQMARRLDPAVLPLGVFVDAEVWAVAGIAVACGLHAVQLHGNEDNAYMEELGRLLPNKTQIIKAVRVKDAGSLKRAEELSCDLFLLDAWDEDQNGGTGQTFNWELVMGFPKPFLLAGGLDCENVRMAIDTCAPVGVDVSSGVETDGNKAAEKIAAFIDTVRRRIG